MSELPTIERAFELAEEGNREAALQLAIEILKTDPNHLEAWRLAASVTDDREQQAHALRQVLTLRPDETWATEQLRKLEDEAEADEDVSTRKKVGSSTKATTPKRTTLWRTSLLRIGGITLAGIAIIMLGIILALKVFSPTLPDVMENKTPTLANLSQSDTPTLSPTSKGLDPDLIASSDTISPTITPVSPSQDTSPPSSETAVVVRVIDGDTIEVELDESMVEVQYLGIYVPTLDDLCGQQAAEFNASLVDGQTVSLVREISDTDSEGRLLRHVYVGSLFVNAEMIAQGYALAAITPPDVGQSEYFASLEQQAREGNLGCVNTLIPESIPSDEGESTPPGAGNTSTTEATPPSDSEGPPNFPTSTP